MRIFKKVLCALLVMLFTLITVFNYLPVRAAAKATAIPQIQFANPPVTEYKVGDRVRFDIFSPSYGGRVEYRVVLWNDSKKTYYDLWNPQNGYPTSYYTKWQPYGNNIFTLGWIINEPGSYRITVYVKRLGIPNSKTALKGMNCDSYRESVAFRVRSREATVHTILPLADITVNQGTIPVLPSTVKAVMSDGTEKTLSVVWDLVDTTKPGIFAIQGSVQGTTLKAGLRLVVNPAQTTLNIYSVEAGSINTINVNLTQSIGVTPDLSRFSLSGYVNGYGVSNIRLYSLFMSTDRKTIQLSTDTLTLGSWYTLKVDGKEFVFQVPYNVGSGNYGYNISLTARDMIVSVGSQMHPDITVYPSDAALSFISYNTSIARFNSYTGRIEGVSPGTATFNVTASKSGYTSASGTFNVTVRGNTSYLMAEPSVLTESAANDGSLVSGEITVTSLYEYFRPDINTNNVLLYNLPQGFTYTVQRVSSTTLKIYIAGRAINHSSANDTVIHVTVLNGQYGGSDYLNSNDIQIKFNVKTVTSINPLADIYKPLGTLKANLELPAKATINLSDGTQQEVNITSWDNGTPPYNENLSNIYEFKGTIALPSGVTNPGNTKAQVKVVLGSQNVNVVPEDFGVFDGDKVKGYNVGFRLEGAKASGVERIVINLFKDSKLLASNVSDGVLEEYPDAASLSAPFDVFGTFNYVADGNWSYSGWLGSKQDIPTEAVIMVIFKNGVTVTVSNTNLTGDKSIFTKGNVIAEDFGVVDSEQVRGYNVGFRLIDAKASDVESIEVSLYKGAALLATNTSKGVLANYPGATSLSAPFDLSGKFNYAADGNWTYSGWLGLYTDIPTKAVIKVTFKNGIVKTVTNSNLTGR